jgi:hypothetical protein
MLISERNIGGSIDEQIQQALCRQNRVPYYPGSLPVRPLHHSGIQKLIPMENYILVHPEHGLMLIDTGMVYDSAPASARSSLASVDMPLSTTSLRKLASNLRCKTYYDQSSAYDHISQVHLSPDAVSTLQKPRLTG